MTTSRNVDQLTYTYIGQDEPQGPNCHKCMNELFNEGKLMDVQMVYISAPVRQITCQTDLLILFNGRETPFSWKSIAEDFLVQSCVRCARTHLKHHAAKASTNLTTKKIRTFPFIKPAPSKCSRPNAVSKATASMEKQQSKLSDKFSKDNKALLSNLPIKFTKIPFTSSGARWLTGKQLETLSKNIAYLRSSELMDDGFAKYLLLIYPHMKVLNKCSMCDLPVSSSPNAQGYLSHYLSFGHIQKAAENKWDMGSDYVLFKSHLLSYLQETGRRDISVLLPKFSAEEC